MPGKGTHHRGLHPARQFIRAGGNVTEKKEAERQMGKRIEDDVRSILIPRVKGTPAAGGRQAGRPYRRRLPAVL